MSQATNLAELRGTTKPIDPAIRAGFDTVGGFDLIQRTAKLFASSNIVPTQFQGNLPNCVIAVDMALRMGANPLMVCQNLYIVHGRPAWSAQFLIATMNQCGRFSAIRYEFQGKPGNDDWGCKAVATELATKEKLEGPLITIGLSKKEGWFGKSGSKWQTMPELMLRYRAAAWFVRAYAPEIAMGLQTAEEVKDTFDLEPAGNGTYAVSLDGIKPPKKQGEAGEVIDMTTGEVKQPEPVEAPPKGQSAQAAEERTIPCPRKDNALVEDEDCFHCKERNGCPSWAQEG
ncbi:hypothetical protein [Desulfovibrio desulfuricans]|uniref:hypothetical protein n=1 Tax=Desulfovibrio desulfuricans TaxID=876 RepID=UPI0039841E2F